MLTEYTNLDEKKAYFENGDKLINTKKEFDEQFEMLKDSKSNSNQIFRGCGEAKYKLFTSSQRYWIDNQLEKQNITYHTFIKKLIKNCKDWNYNTLKNFFVRNGISSTNTLAYLSYMQHHGVLTPLIDFTDNPFIGLFFAVEKENPIVAKNEIDYYCSLYIVNITNKYFSTTVKQFHNGIKLNQLSYEKDLASYPILLITEKNESYRIINNANISNQEGLFFYNNDPQSPIEEVYSEELNSIKNVIGIDIVNENNYEEKFAYCLNIHKNLRSYVLHKLSNHNATDKFVYPNNNQLRRDIINETLKEV